MLAANSTLCALSEPLLLKLTTASAIALQAAVPSARRHAAVERRSRFRVAGHSCSEHPAGRLPGAHQPLAGRRGVGVLRHPHPFPVPGRFLVL